jgi:hypothetical protein
MRALCWLQNMTRQRYSRAFALRDSTGILFRPEIYKNEHTDLRTGCSTGRNMTPRPDMKEAAN